MEPSLFARLARRYEPHSDVDRRQFLKVTLAGSAGFLLSDPDTHAENPHGKRKSRRITVIGGGFSGLACAYELMSVGYDVTVLESRNRVGGRVLSFHDLAKGETVEGGGEYIGSNHSAWLAYARKFRLDLFPGPVNEAANPPVVLGGRRMNNKEAMALFEEMKVVNQHLTADAVPVNADEPWKSPRAAELDNTNTAHWLRNVPVSRYCKLLFGSQLAANNGAALERQSYLGNLAQVRGGGLEKYWTDTEIYRCRGGNQRLAHKFANALGDRLRLETPVASITVKDHGVSVHCSGGDTFQGDDVVLAVPPSVWHRIKFEPELPRGLNPQMGIVVKYLSTFQNRFWEKEHLGPDAASDDFVSMTWDATEAQNGREAVLTAFSGGPAGAICRKQWSQNRDRAYREELQKLYPDYSKYLIGSRFMDWPGDPWAQAGYSFPAPGEVTAIGPILRSGIGRLHFAGEHTCYKFIGYMEGALHSGVSLARRLVQTG